MSSCKKVITMPPVTLDGDTLGEKHKHFNKLVEDAIANEHYELQNITGDESDIDNLLKIDIASKIRNVDYIIEVMKSNDMLYAATAIKKSTWLITDPQYANIINPEYLHTQLLPSMNTKTFNKLMLHIRLNLKDESRFEGFYEYLKEKDSAYKWLQNCSIPFIENVIKSEPTNLLPLYFFKRLCRRSAHFLKYYARVKPWYLYEVKEQILFLLKSHTAEVLDVVEDTAIDYMPVIGKKKTKFLMKTCPQRILNQFDRYGYKTDPSVVAQYLNKKEIKTFLYKQPVYQLHYNVLKHFIQNMPEEERFEFVRKTFIDKTELSLFCRDEENMYKHNVKPYQWYEFASFDIALPEFKKMILKEKSPYVRRTILSILIRCARRNPKHIKTLLKFFKDKHINAPFKNKIQFVNNLLSQTSTHELDVESWNVLNQLFHSMKVYTESENNVQLCLEFITLYKVLRDEPVPEIVEQKLKFNSFKHVQGKLTPEMKSKMFSYLFNITMKKLESKDILDQADFEETMNLLIHALTLLKDWKKDIISYPFLLQKIQQLNKIKQENVWNIDMSCLYNMKKSWRKHMFEESLSLCLSEEACLNALKHKPQLLTRHDEEIDTLRTNDAISLQRLLAKMRVYWPHSLAQHWTDAYLLNLNKPTGQKAVVRGLFKLLAHNQVIDIAKKYVPDDFKIKWGETNQADISIRKNIAKNLYVARPLIPLDTILCYAKGDYLQYAVPSLNSILSILSEVESREHVSKLLDAPVSLQKFGLNLAFSKLKYDQNYKSILLKTWCNTKNLTIRSLLFTHTHTLINTVKTPSLEKDLWELLSYFIDNLSAHDNTDIHDLLGNAESVPISVRKDYYMKSYTFLIASANCEHHLETLIEYAPMIMNSLDEQFVLENVLSSSGLKFYSCKLNFMKIFACYILCGKSEDDQLRRFRKVVESEFDEVFNLWESVQSKCFYVQNNFNEFLKALVWHFRIYYLTIKEIPIPVKLFVEILTKIEKNISLVDNYLLYTSWKLTTEYFKLVKEFAPSFDAVDSSKFFETHFHKYWGSDEIINIWRDIHYKISPSLGPIIVQYLKEDIAQYNCPTIYNPFTDALDKMFQTLAYQTHGFELETLKYMLDDCDFIPSFLVVLKLMPKSEGTEIRNKIESHPSATVRLHYYSYFRDIPKESTPAISLTTDSVKRDAT